MKTRQRNADLLVGNNEFIVKGATAHRFEIAGINVGIRVHVSNLNDEQSHVRLSIELPNRKTLSKFSDELTNLALNGKEEDHIQKKLKFTRS